MTSIQDYGINGGSRSYEIQPDCGSFYSVKVSESCHASHSLVTEDRAHIGPIISLCHQRLAAPDASVAHFAISRFAHISYTGKFGSCPKYLSNGRVFRSRRNACLLGTPNRKRLNA